MSANRNNFKGVLFHKGDSDNMSSTKGGTGQGRKDLNFDWGKEIILQERELDS